MSRQDTKAIQKSSPTCTKANTIRVGQGKRSRVEAWVRNDPSVDVCVHQKQRSCANARWSTGSKNDRAMLERSSKKSLYDHQHAKLQQESMGKEKNELATLIIEVHTPETPYLTSVGKQLVVVRQRKRQNAWNVWRCWRLLEKIMKFENIGWGDVTYVARSAAKARLIAYRSGEWGKRTRIRICELSMRRTDRLSKAQRKVHRIGNWACANELVVRSTYKGGCNIENRECAKVFSDLKHGPIGLTQYRYRMIKTSRQLELNISYVKICTGKWFE